MNKIWILGLMLSLGFFLTVDVQASVSSGKADKADRYYQQGQFKKAHKTYFKLAKKGDHYSQHRVSQMYAKGEGTKTDLVQAYAWSVLATEGGFEQAEKYTNSLWDSVKDKDEAREQAEKLRNKYGDRALEMSASSKSQQRRNSSCTGTRLGC